jgi:hypothetical protein
MSKVEFATHRRITAVWTIAFERVDGGAKVLAYSRDIEIGYESEQGLPHGSFIEDKDRTAKELVLSKGNYWRKADLTLEGEERLKVVNPQHVFDYGSKF